MPLNRRRGTHIEGAHGIRVHDPSAGKAHTSQKEPVEEAV